MWVKWEMFPTAGACPAKPDAYFWDRLLVVPFARCGSAGWCWPRGATGQKRCCWCVGFVLPQIVWNWLIGFIILQQHTHPAGGVVLAELDLPCPELLPDAGAGHAAPDLPGPVPLADAARDGAHRPPRRPGVPLYQLAEAQKAVERVPPDIVACCGGRASSCRRCGPCQVYDYGG